MTSWPEMSAIELFVAVADHGSLGAGARAVGMAQPNASRSLSRLERGLGVTLVTRSTTGSKLTVEGMLALEWARAVVDSARALVDGTAGLTDSGGPVLMVSASQTIAEHVLPRWLAELNRRRPGVALDLRVANTAAVVDDVRSGSASVGFIEGPEAPPGLHSQIVATDELVLVVAPEHHLAEHAGALSAQELRSLPLITREAGSGTRVTLEEALGAPARTSQVLSSIAAVRLAVQAGTGQTVLSRLAVDDALRAGTLLAVPVDLDLRRHLRAVWAGPTRLSGRAAELVDAATTMH
ncbi:LysR family transcriptional regulator [Janibacter cremeus]|uniref:DNA-binding transcriptional LysR family regulator n=1 Tax=Janibacter cremeus TaxID=1285192 RepID=A0A852VV34_9MICO|nr:LysR family transcriptional regulator [Janibacter cremeus]NYF97421.1 DNA-binding transcriptional LysR family regulator [Janibacter cremeus]